MRVRARARARARARVRVRVRVTGVLRISSDRGNGRIFLGILNVRFRDSWG